MSDAKYPNTKIYTEQGGNKQVAKDGAEFEFYNNTSFDSENIYGVLTRSKDVTIMDSAGVLSDQGNGSYPTILPSTYGTIWLSTVQSNMSAKLPSARCGQVLYIRYTIAGGESVCSIWLYGSAGCGLSGALIMLSTGSDASSIIINNSAASMGWVKLYGVKDGTWAVEDQKQVTEQPSS